MSNKLSGLLILCISTFWLSGCAYFRASGPCLGVGCPAHTAGESGQYKMGQGPKPQTSAAPHAGAPKAQVATNAPTSSDAQTASTPQAAPQQANTAEAKAPAQNRFTAFFARLIPHHNKTAKPAPAAD
jgi:hypothetical protein